MQEVVCELLYSSALFLWILFPLPEINKIVLIALLSTSGMNCSQSVIVGKGLPRMAGLMQLNQIIVMKLFRA